MHPEKTFCVLCDKELASGTRGVIIILDNLQRKGHIEKYILKKINFALPGQSSLISTYGLHPVYKEFMVPEKTLPAHSNIPLPYHIKHMEGMVLSFIAEHSFSFSSAKNIVELAKEMMYDPKAPNKLKVAWETASYKMCYGLAKGLKKQLKDN